MRSNDMMNHEHYPDPTAGEAIRRMKRKRNRPPKHIRQPLTYQLQEVQGFKQIKEHF